MGLYQAAQYLPLQEWEQAERREEVKKALLRMVAKGGAENITYNITRYDSDPPMVACVAKGWVHEGRNGT